MIIPTALSAGFEIVERNNTQYLAHDVVAQREGVYMYPGEDGRVQRELVTTEELHKSVDGADEKPVLIDHPDAPPNTPKLTTNPHAEYTEVGLWGDYERLNDGIAGRVLIDIDEIGEHDGRLQKYIRKAAENGVGEVSTGYGITGVEDTGGRYNGKSYDVKQKGIQLDHLALLPDATGDCSVEDGCGLGRANETEDVLARTNNYMPPTDDGETPEDRLNISYEATSVSTDQYTDDEWDASIESEWPNPSENEDAPEVLDQVYAAIPQDDRDAKSNWKLPFRDGPDEPINTRALVSIKQRIDQTDDISSDVKDEIMEWVEGHLADAPDDLFGSMKEDRGNIFLNIGSTIKERFSRNNMQDADKIDTLVDEHGFDRENLEPLDGSQCLQRIHERFVEQDDDDDLDIEEKVNEAVESKVEDIVEEKVNEAVDIDEEQILEEINRSREHEKNVEILAESDEVPLDEEQLERMNEDVVADMVDELEVDSDDDDDDDRVNYAGRPTGESFDESDFGGDDGFDVASPGRKIGGDD